jgi:hypothetical protein
MFYEIDITSFILEKCHTVSFTSIHVFNVLCFSVFKMTHVNMLNVSSVLLSIHYICIIDS